MRHTAEALHLADAALSRIHDLLNNLARTLAPTGEGRRRSPRLSADWQKEIDSTLEAIDEIVRATESGDGRKLLDGKWSPGAVAGGGRSRGRAAPRRSGAEAGVKFLAILRTGGAQAVGRAEPAEILAIVRNNAAKIASQRRQLASFLSERLLPLQGILEVTEENVSANQTVLTDADFASAAGQITGVEALLNQCRLDRPEASPDVAANPLASRLTIHHNDDE